MNWQHLKHSTISVLQFRRFEMLTLQLIYPELILLEITLLLALLRQSGKTGPPSIEGTKVYSRGGPDKIYWYRVRNRSQSVVGCQSDRPDLYIFQFDAM